MEKGLFPDVITDSPDVYGVEKGIKFRYDRTIGMYTVVEEGEEIGPGEQWSWFKSQMALSPSLVNDLIEEGLVVIEGEEVTEDTPEPQPDVAEEEINVWDKADLTMTCGRCGHHDFVTEAIGGATLYMPTNSEAVTRLVCSNCGNVMSLKYTNGRMFTEEEKAAIEAQKEAAKKDETLEEEVSSTPDPEVKEEEDVPQEKSE